MQIVVENDKIVQISEKSVKIPKNGYVIIGPKKKLKRLKLADNVNLDINIDKNWKNVKHIIGGGPYFVKEGEIFVDSEAEKLTGIRYKNPRTAIGYTKEGYLVLVTVDGRESSSVGMTFNELAKFQSIIFIS